MAIRIRGRNQNKTKTVVNFEGAIDSLEMTDAYSLSIIESTSPPDNSSEDDDIDEQERLDASNRASQHRISRHQRVLMRLAELERQLRSVVEATAAGAKAASWEKIRPMWLNSKIRKGVIDEGVDNKIPDDDLKIFKLSEDIYSILACWDVKSKPFWISLIVVSLLQITLLILLLIDQLNWGAKENQWQMPVNAETNLRIAQFLSGLVALLFQEDLRIGISGLMRGIPDSFRCENKHFRQMTTYQWYFGVTIRFTQGLLSLLASFILLMQAESVLDLLMNFMGLQFVSTLDDMTFNVGLSGYLGRNFKRCAEAIVEAEFYRETKAEHITVKRFSLAWFKRKAHLGGVFVVMGMIVFGYSYFRVQQDLGVYAVSTVQVEFGDETMSYLGLVNGCYKKSATVEEFDGHLVYEKLGSDDSRGRFGYCSDLDGKGATGWTLFVGNDPCKDIIVKSDQTKTFDLLEATDSQWFTYDDLPIEYLRVSESSDCDQELLKQSLKNADESCKELEFDGDSDGFEGSRYYLKLPSSGSAEDNKFDATLSHPIYVVKSTSETADDAVVLFTGRRWVVAKPKMISGAPTNSSALEDYFYKERAFRPEDQTGKWVSLVSEVVESASDQGEPVGLQWYFPRYDEDEERREDEERKFKFVSADYTRPGDAVFTCERCDAIKNPCKFEGICKEDGTCQCNHGATGRLCDIKPLESGDCNQYFNSAGDNYDGGECCVDTCSNFREDGSLKENQCGVGATTFAFGKDLSAQGVGFPNCIDPLMVPVSIRLKKKRGWASPVPFRYTIGVQCDGGDKRPLNVALDYNYSGVDIPPVGLFYYEDSTETIKLADKSNPCNLTISRLQSDGNMTLDIKILDDSVSPSPIMAEVSTAGDTNVAIPSIYIRCLKKSLANYIDTLQLYSGSYQDQAVSWLDEEIPACVGEQCKPDESCPSDDYLLDRYALLASSFAETPYNDTLWVTRENHCFWSRVDCKDDRVVELNYDGIGNGPLNGLLAPEFTLLTHLESIAIFGNRFTGSIPTEIASLTRLTSLSMPNNTLSGPLPTQLGSLSALALMYLSDNLLTGTIPTELAYLTALQELYMENNFLGGVTIPSELGSLSGLKILSISNSTLIGSLPPELFTMRSLEILSMNNNFLSGPIPSNLKKLENLHALFLNNNRLNSTIPLDLAKATSLVRLQIGNNGLTGPIPSELKSMTALNELLLNGNRLSGQLPSELGLLTNVQSLALSENPLLNGPMPSEIGSMGALAQLSLGNCRFDGTIPASFGMMSNLQVLNLANNELTGAIPSELALLPKLWYIDLSGNNVSGTIPTEFVTMPSLVALILSQGSFNSSSVPVELSQKIYFI